MKKHLVDFTGPSCTCVSWQKSHYPCKHFYDVFARYSDSLPLYYRSSFFITLDMDHLVINRPDSSAQNASVPQDTSDDVSSPSGHPASGISSGNESPMDCEDVEAESEEKSDCHLPDNSARSTSPVSSSKKLRRFLDKIDTIKNTAFMVDDETTGYKTVGEHSFPTAEEPRVN